MRHVGRQSELDDSYMPARGSVGAKVDQCISLLSSDCFQLRSELDEVLYRRLPGGREVTEAVTEARNGRVKSHI
jgi:hypothetical protein